MTIEYPDIDHVLPPVDAQGKPTGAKPRRRHYPDCRHFTYSDGTTLGTPRPATETEMRTLAACENCISRTDSQRETPHPRADDHRPLGTVCPHCFIELPSTGECTNCEA